MTVRDEVIIARRGYALILPQDSAFILACPRRPYRGVAVNLPPGADGATAGGAGAIPLDDRCLRLAIHMEAVLSDPEPGSVPLLEHLGLALCHAVTARSGPAATADPLVAEARLRIRAHLGSEVPLATVLAGMGPSYRQLARRFRAVVGTGPKAWQLGLRLREAVRLLAETDLPVTAIAIEVGWPSPQHLAAVCRRHLGRSPRAIRRAARAGRMPPIPPSGPMP